MLRAEGAALPRARVIALSLLAFVPGLALATLPGWLTGAGAWAAWTLAQPCLLAAAVFALGYQFESGFLASLWRRGVPALLLLALGAGIVAGTTWWPAKQLLTQGSLGAVLALSAIAAAAWLLLWRLWPAPALPFLWEQAAIQARPWPWATARESLRHAGWLATRGGWLGGAGVATLEFAWLAAAPALLLFAPVFEPVPRPLLWSLVAALAAVACVLVVALAARRLADLADLADEPQAAATGERAGIEPVPYTDLVREVDPVEALYAAARAGDTVRALALIDAGVDVQAPPLPGARDQRTLAMLAAVLPDLSLLRRLIADGVDVNLRHHGLTPLLAATRDSYQGRPDAVATLLANGADPDAADRDGATALHHAARSTDPGVAAQLLDAGATVDAVDRHGLTPLAAACASGNWRVAKFLLERGARPQPDGGAPVLLAAAASEDDDEAGTQLLLRHKARVDARGALERTALMSASLHGNAGIARALLAAGAVADACDGHGVTALMEAARSGANAVLRALLVAAPDPDRRDHTGRTVLIIACQSAKADEETLRLLLDAGADPQLRCRDGLRAIDHAVAAGRWTLVAAIDPEFPMPASVCAGEGERLPDLPPAQLLHAALMECRTDRAERALALGGGMSAADRAAACLALAEDQAPLSSLRWLLQRSVDTECAVAGGDCLAFALLDGDAGAHRALSVLLDAGAVPTGAGGLARFLEASLARDLSGRGHELLALRLLGGGADPFGSARRGESPLLLALRLGWLRLAEVLLESGQDPNLRDEAGSGALQVACTMGLENAVRLLVRHGADPQRRGRDGQTPVGRAFAAGRGDLVRWLDWSGWPLPGRRLLPLDLTTAAAAGDLAAVRRLVELGLPLDAGDGQGCTALLRASGNGQLPVVQWLLAHGADPDHAAHAGATCLSAAVSMGFEPVVATLLEHGAGADRLLPGAVTPLMIAAALGLPAIARTLLAHGAQVDARDDSGNSALLAAAQFGFAGAERERAAALMRVLLEAEADPHAVNARGQNALLLLLGAQAEPGVPGDEAGLLPLLELLLERGVALDVADRRGFGPLHLAALHGLPRVLARLLAAGADAGRRDALNRTAHDVALMRGFVDIAQAVEPTRGEPSLARFLRPGD
ncbi:MAG TPA: ankyrin repeat domain-containing protein [Xanthomonadaceae bacterium]|nr:ankyrin repeat domain-containing protein [Xanthomonadaceae bacterium]